MIQGILLNQVKKFTEYKMKMLGCNYCSLTFYKKRIVFYGEKS